MEIFMKPNDREIFKRELEKSKNYFEYGSGGSTYKASLTKKERIISVESDKEWHDKLKEKIENKTNIEFKYIDIKSKPNNWGNPGLGSTLEDWKKYSDVIKEIGEKESKKIDLILIDGRFRVACCLKCFKAINDECIIAFDDFLFRKQYHIVLNYYDIIEKTKDNSLVLLKKKNVEAPNEEIIKEYEKIAN
jgi:hypothetical protein